MDKHLGLNRIILYLHYCQKKIGKYSSKICYDDKIALTLEIQTKLMSII